MAAFPEQQMLFRVLQATEVLDVLDLVHAHHDSFNSSAAFEALGNLTAALRASPQAELSAELRHPGWSTLLQLAERQADTNTTRNLGKARPSLDAAAGC